MTAPNNIQIPYILFERVLEVLGQIDASEYTEDFQCLYNRVLAELRDKQLRIELRDAYGRLAAANKTGDEDAQIEARIEYLKQRNTIRSEPEEGRL